jgi:hypothetical protein
VTNRLRTNSNRTTTTTVTGPANTGASVSVTSDFWQGPDGICQSVLLPREPERFVGNGFVPNIVITLRSCRTADTTNSAFVSSRESLVAASRWQPAARTAIAPPVGPQQASVVETLTATATARFALVQLSRIISQGELEIEATASVHDGDFRQVESQISRLMADLHFESPSRIAEDADVG